MSCENCLKYFNCDPKRNKCNLITRSKEVPDGGVDHRNICTYWKFMEPCEDRTPKLYQRFYDNQFWGLIASPIECNFEHCGADRTSFCGILTLK